MSTIANPPTVVTDHGVLTGLADDDHAQYTTTAEATTIASAAAAAVVDAAPSTLDTLNELAAALGDDANFATTMTTSLAGKSATGHGHAEADVTSLVSDLAGKSSTAHTHTGTYEPSGTVSTHAAAADPHTGYQKESEKSAANGYASLGAGTKVPTGELGGAGADATKFLRGDQTWAVPAGGGGSDMTFARMAFR